MIGLGLPLVTRYGPGGEEPPIDPPIDPPAGDPPTTNTDPAVTAIGTEGWRATYTNPGTFDPESLPKYVSVLSPGFDAMGQATQIARNLTLMGRVREPFPNEATFTPSDVALSDFVYAGDTVLENGTAVAVGSTKSYELPQAMWLNHDRERAVTTTHTVRLAVAHAHARNGRPVAAVQFIATDSSGSSVSLTVSDLTLATYAASGLTVPHYAAVLDLSSLAQGDIVTVDAVIYPWVGEAFMLSTDADPYPSPNLTVLTLLNDRTGGFGTNYAYVDASAGDDGTGVASVVAATAQASPFATIKAAALAIQAANNVDFGRNNASGGIVRLEDGVHTHSDFSSVAVGEIPLLIESVGSNAVYQDQGSSNLDGIPNLLKIRGVTLRKTAGSIVFLDSNARSASTHILVLEDCTFDANGQSAYSAWIYRTGRFWLINCDGDDAGQVNSFSTSNKTVIAIGSGGRSVGPAVFHAAGCRDISEARFVDNPAVGDRPAQVGGFVGWCHLGQSNDGDRIVNIDSEIGPRGLAMVGNVFEHFGGDTGPAIAFSADSVTAPARNLVAMCNTAVGVRSNFLYQDTGSAIVEKQGIYRFNVDHRWNSKDDAFPPGDGGRTGNWAWQYRVGFRANAALRGSSDGKPPGPGNNWLGEIAALGDVSGTVAAPLSAGFADDQSLVTGGTGGGDYTPGAGSQLPAIPATMAPYSHDQLGNPITDDGSAVIGAIQT